MLPCELSEHRRKDEISCPEEQGEEHHADDDDK